MPYVPDAGDFIWINFSPQSGHEQAGHRPALVCTPASYNGLVGLAIVCPITSKAKGYPFEVVLPRESKVRGVVLADQATCVDWRSREASRIGTTTALVMKDVQKSLSKLLRLPR
jgi:mRNA interferase MazF